VIEVEFTEEQRACLRSLFITDPTEDKNSLKRRKGDRAFGTCSWIFETEELRHWLGLSTYECQEERNILWLYGNPGTGKSTMAITLSEELPSKSNFHDGSKTLAYFFCDSSSDVNRTAIAVLRGLLYQLVKQHPPLMHHLLPRYNERKDKLFGSFDALWTVLLDIAKSSDGMEFYYIIDALDECEPDSQKSLLEQIHQTFSNLNSKGSAPSNMHVLITSRPYHEIRRSLSIFRSKDLATYEAVASDLRKVIKEKVEVLSKRNRYPKALVADVSRVLKEKAEGTFLWVGIACDELAQVQSRNALKTLQALPRGLNSLYQKLLETAITTSGEEDKTMILEMLSFVAFALRPLTLAELSGACQLYPDEEEDCRLQFTQEIIDSCRLMIVVQNEHVRLLHKSVKDFLSRETQNIDSHQVNARMAYRCISNIIQSPPLKWTEEPHNAGIGFLNYSTVYWPQHASLSKTEFTVIREHESFFSLNSGSWNKWMRLYNILKVFPYTRLDVGFSTLHAAARWGIPELIRFALNETNACFQDSEPTGEEEIYVDSDFTTFRGVTPLTEAAKSGQISILKILLERVPRHQQINQDVIKAAAGNIMNGDKVMAFLLDQYEHQIRITNDMIKVVSQNRSYGKLIIRLLLERCKDQIQLNTHIVSTVIENFDVLAVTFLLKQCEGHFQINEGIIEAAAQNYLHGNEIMTLMLERYKDQVRDNPRLVSTIIQNFDDKVVKLVLSQCGNRIQLSDDIFRVAARNYQHEKVMFLLLDRYGEEISITPEKIWLGVPRISKIEYNQAGSPQQYNTWPRYAASTGDSAAKAAFMGYWRSINREGNRGSLLSLFLLIMPVAGERYWNVPFARNPNFVQNDVITKIENSVSQHAAPARIVVCGLGGVGKTQIALELAYRIRKHDPEYSIFWVSCDHAEIFERSLVRIADMLGFHDVEPADAKASVRHYLSQGQAGKCLLIFNSADDLPQLKEYLPQIARAQILVTTRDKKLASTIASPDVIMIDPSTSNIEVALELLENPIKDKSLLDNQAAAIAIVQRLNWHPLAITMAAQYIVTENITLSQFLYRYDRQQLGTNRKCEGDEERTKYRDTIEGFFLKTFQRIQQQNQLATDYLSFMACMYPDTIPQSLLPPAELEKEMDAIELLKDSSMIKETAQGYFAIHRLLRNFIRELLKSTHQFRRQVLKVADRLSEVFPNDDEANRDIWHEYLPHATSLLEEVKFQQEQAKYISLMQRVGRCLFSDERYGEAVTLFETIVNIQRTEASGIDYSLLSSMADLARTYEKQNRINEAKELELQIMEFSKRVLATQYPHTLEIIRQSSVLQNQEKYEHAHFKGEKAPEGRKKGLELEHVDNLHYLSRLGLALDRQGKHEKAETLHRLAFGGLHGVLGPENYSTLTGIFSLAYSLIAQDKKEEAFTLLEEFIKLRGKSLGSDRIDTGDASYCRSQWEDYYRMQLFRTQQEQKMISSNRESQHMEDTPAIMITVPPLGHRSETPAQRFIRDHPLLRAPWTGQSVQEGHDLQDVD
jgi:Cdc6-like AAA superfamily ATPase